MRFQTLFVSLFFACTAFCSFAAAPADGSASATQSDNAGALALTEFTALNIQNAGPEKAKGVIYFIDGLDPQARAADNFKPTFPYLHTLNAQFGWDVINAKYPNSKSDVGHSIPPSVEFVVTRIKALRAQGYKKVIIAGQSWGGWVSINVARTNNASKELDGLLIVAPAAYGARIWDGKDNPYYMQNFTEYVRDVKAVRTPTIAVFFAGDEFDPGERGEVTDALFFRARTPLLLINRPAGFIGHGAAWLPPFADIFAACIDDFLRAPQTKECKNVDPTPHLEDNPAITEAQVLKNEEFTPVRQVELTGRQFILTSPDISVRILKFGRNSIEVATADGMLDTDIQSNDNEACLADECYRLYRASKDKYIGFREDGSFAGWLAPIR